MHINRYASHNFFSVFFVLFCFFCWIYRCQHHVHERLATSIMTNKRNIQCKLKETVNKKTLKWNITKTQSKDTITVANEYHCKNELKNYWVSMVLRNALFFSTVLIGNITNNNYWKWNFNLEFILVNRLNFVASVWKIGYTTINFIVIIIEKDQIMWFSRNEFLRLENTKELMLWKQFRMHYFSWNSFMSFVCHNDRRSLIVVLILKACPKTHWMRQIIFFAIMYTVKNHLYQCRQNFKRSEQAVFFLGLKRSILNDNISILVHEA